MAFNFGGFGAGFSQGFGNGVRIGNTLRGIAKEQKVADMAAQGLNEAQAAQDAYAANQVKEIGADQPTAKPANAVTAPAAVPQGDTVTADPTKAAGADEVRPVVPTTGEGGTDVKNPGAAGIGFNVGGKIYASRDEAMAEAKKSAPSLDSFLAEKQYPKMRQAYLENGDIENAEKMRLLMETQKGKDATAQYVKFMAPLMGGDTKKAIEEFGKFYKYVDDGVEFKDGEVVNGMFRLKFKRAGSDEEQVMEFSRPQLARIGMAYNPAELVKLNLLDVREAEKAALSAAAENAKDERNFKQDIFKSDRKHEQDIEKETIKAEREDAKPGDTGKKIRDLEKSGIFSKDEIKAIVRASSADVGKAPHPDTIRKEVYNKLAASQFQKVRVVGADGKERMATFGSLSEEEKRGVVEREASIIQRVSGGSVPAQSGNQAAGAGITPQAAGGGKTPYWDGSKMVYR